jgi:hypothetical protein
MIDLTAVFGNYSGIYPNVLAQNVTAAGAGDGTEFIAAMVDDEWGWSQDLLQRAGYTDFDGVTEAAGTSQRYAAMQRCFAHPGQLVGWYGASDPSASNARLLPLEGQTNLLIADYPDLIDTCYVGNGNNSNSDFVGFRKFSDAGGVTPNTAGPYFNIPDARGQFLRGLDTGALVDPEGASRDFPDVQTRALEVHGHELTTLSTSLFAVASTATAGGGVAVLTVSATPGADRLLADDQISEMFGAEFALTDTRPTNLNVRWCVVY